MLPQSVPDPFACPSLADVPIFTGFARAVLEGLSGGRVFICQGGAHVLHDYGMSLLWGEGVAQAFDEVARHLREGGYRDKPEWLQIDPRLAHLGWEAALGREVERFGRVNFRFDETLFRARHGKPVLPPGWSLRAMREAEFERPDITVSPRPFWRDFAVFKDHGGGVCAVKDGEVGAVAFSATRFDDWLEIGIETLAQHRGMGLARAVAVAMIEKCLANGLTPVWACRKENTGSYRLAQSLGFVVTKELPFYKLPA